MRKTKSVLNTDSFDRRQYKELYQMSQKLKELEKKGKELLPSFPHLQGDIWASFFKMNPEIRNDLAEDLITNKMLMEKIMSNETYQKHRDSTKLDDLMSAIACMTMADKTLKWINSMINTNHELQQSYQKMIGEMGGRQSTQENRQKADEAKKDFEKNMKRVIQQEIDSFNSHITSAIEAAKETKQALKDMVSGLSPGSGKAELKKIPLRDKLTLAEKLSGNQKIREISHWTGRMKGIARKKQKTKHNQSIERSGVGMGSMVERLLPSELAMYSHPATRLDFLRRFAEGQTMLYDPNGKETLGKGPIVLCLDQSGSMEHLDTQAKGFALALMSIARKQRRDFALILFSTSAITIKFAKGKIAPNDMVELATTFLNGGTNFYAPLKQALDVIEESQFKKADLIFVTDGQASLPHAFVETFNELKNERQFNVLSVLLGHRDMYTVKLFSDEIVTAESFLDASDTAFEI
ncbi:VWA domain-containing protein [Caldalkalibacillus thermarum]|uniref:vWA domain-containing protein n=1 Tax=Caldalkalibacillus thermarum TaxID=296745 RepID=UPI00166B735B|nr:VWA domain-containing protein [Caldalkalibacillus thermarum]GGK22448.1 VWA domain-containing protein [Caldalkalibacillus thermarum]